MAYRYELVPKVGQVLKSRVSNYPKEEHALRIGETFGQHLANLSKVQVILWVIHSESGRTTQTRTFSPKQNGILEK